MDNGEEHAEEEHQEERGGFAIPIGKLGAMMAEQAAEHARAHDRAHMQSTAMELAINNFLDSLDAEQLVALDMMFCVDQKSRVNIYWHGQIVNLLRVVHKVNARGESLISPDLP